MCGIVGSNFLSDNFHASIDLIRHRGPDNQSSLIYKNNQFGHTRLSIIDLDNEANQPMEFDDIILIFNGEIYNYKKLIKDEKLICKTKSDTEVIIRLYQKYGKNFVKKLEGMFAFSIFDKTKNLFFCARDRFGKKPFYYYSKNGKFIFASEIKSIVKILDKTPTLNHEALHEYLTFWAPIGNNTFYEDIFKLTAGDTLTFENNKVKTDSYFEIDNIATKHYQEKKILVDIEDLLVNAVEARLVSDVKIASLLSGGVDSSLISSIYSKITGKSIDTYCIGYDEYNHYNELNYAKIVSQHINSKHHEIIINKKDYIDSIDNMLFQLDEPLGDSAAIPTYLISKQISSDGFKVALSGEGSDEIFLGYDKYFNLLKNKDLYLTINSAFKEDEKIDLFNNYQEVNYDFLQKYNSRAKQLSYTDIKIWIAEVLMTKIDKMSMSHSLELRTPFLDHKLVNYLLSVDDKVKIGDTNKYLLKKIANKYLPNKIVHRRKKGFSSPFIEWLYEEKKDEILSTILKTNKELNVFNEKYVIFLYNEGNEKRFKQHIWNLYIFSKWFNKVYL